MTLFKRRNKHPVLKKLKELFWPSQGWRRTFHYYRHRLFRGGDTAYKITAGLALGIAISFVPLIGTHLIQAAVFGFILRTSFIAAFIGTAFGNPWTFPFLFWLAYKTGAFVILHLGGSELTVLPDFMNYHYFTTQPSAFFHDLLDYPFQLFLPMILGGYICAFLIWPIAYGILYYPVILMHKAYHQAKIRKK